MAIYLVTGSAGFIGAKVAEMLLEQGHQVVGIDNLNDYYDVRLKHHRLQGLNTQSGFRFQQLDIESQSCLDNLFKTHSFDAVLNLAARAGVRQSMVDPHVYMATNAMGTLNILESMRRSGVRKMVLASTSSLYAGLPMPFSEDQPVNTPISPYAASKKAAEMMGYTYHALYDLDISITRYFTVFGPLGRPDMALMRFIKWIAEGTPIEMFGDGSQSRDFTYIDDIALGTIAALKPVGYEVFNLGGGNHPISLKQVISWIEEDLGRSARIETKGFHQADMKTTWADIGKAATILNWTPKIAPRDGVRHCVQYYQNHRAFFDQLAL